MADEGVDLDVGDSDDECEVDATCGEDEEVMDAEKRPMGEVESNGAAALIRNDTRKADRLSAIWKRLEVETGILRSPR